MSEAVAAKAPLDEVMLAMDVVDTLRHRQLLVQRELNADDREQRLIDRLREIYAAQGMDVPDAILAEGVRALEEDRFVYEPPATSFSVRLARLYVKRGGWLKKLGIVLSVVLMLWALYYFLISAPAQRELEQLPKELSLLQNNMITYAKEETAINQAKSHYDRGINALRNDDIDTARHAVDSLRDLSKTVTQSYQIKVVSRPGEYTAFWRIPDANSDARNYYIVVEAISTDGTLLKLPITSEEDSITREVTRWGVRVDQNTFNRIANDKKDDGIVQQRDFGKKKTGYLSIEYRYAVRDGNVTQW